MHSWLCIKQVNGFYIIFMEIIQSHACMSCLSVVSFVCACMYMGMYMQRHTPGELNFRVGINNHSNVIKGVRMFSRNIQEIQDMLELIIITTQGEWNTYEKSLWFCRR